ncbi:ribosome small subunit-dependent GTPase A [Desulfocurvibacter africanus PCS]|uniref:Small ribosomal subunit biogenesis GTPase RsgA n=1 Tax=Desulfocurvibacter africanus PCS TaxID=1262666 RepID=M5PQV0_DESAF|nr:ribosome small subunit-dependent GTPase A [Desulfocurvibacter africanus]EMG36742.1 ribosome small subunit-dependent GTPase A [Desulfocurvibacter africanus PCS]
MHDLISLGWSQVFESLFLSLNDPTLVPARVAAVDRGRWTLLGPDLAVSATLSGRLSNQTLNAEDLPVVGDWVAARVEGGSAMIEHVLPRRTSLMRKAAGRAQRAQPLCANIDLVIVTSALDAKVSPNRVERTLALVWDGGAVPLVVLTKADLAPDAEEIADELRARLLGVDVVATSSRAEDGLDALRPYLQPGRTVVFLGASGAGKSSLVNRILGQEHQATGEVRADDARGRHVTTRRELFIAPAGAIVVDTPGLRELGLWGAEEGLDAVFADIAALALECRFRDCGHGDEPGCAVVRAVGQGQIAPDRLEHYLRLRAELASSRERLEARSPGHDDKRWKTVHKSIRHRNKLHEKLGLKH